MCQVWWERCSVIFQKWEEGKIFIGTFTGNQTPFLIKTVLGPVSKFWLILAALLTGSCIPLSEISYSEMRFQGLQVSLG